MSCYCVTPFRASHLVLLPLAPGIHAGVMTETRAKGYERFPSETFWREGVPLACYGMILPWPGRGEVWACLRDPLPPRSYTLLSRITYRLWHEVETHQLHRVGAQVQRTFGPGIRFLEWLGLKPEGVLHQYGPDGMDYLSYAWVGPVHDRGL